MKLFLALFVFFVFLASCAPAKNQTIKPSSKSDRDRTTKSPKDANQSDKELKAIADK